MSHCLGPSSKLLFVDMAHSDGSPIWLIHMTRWLTHLAKWLTHFAEWLTQYDNWLIHLFRWLIHLSNWLTHLARWLTHIAQMAHPLGLAFDGINNRSKLKF